MMLTLFTMLGSLALLMFGMKSMSEALQKMAGPQLRHALGAMTSNRFTGLLTGSVVTASVQSSTATTVMTVSFVNAGLLTLTQAISVIMGANIGTTFTAWIIALGASFDISIVSYIGFFLGIILIYMKKHRYIGDFLFGLGLLLLGVRHALLLDYLRLLGDGWCADVLRAVECCRDGYHHAALR